MAQEIPGKTEVLDVLVIGESPVDAVRIARLLRPLGVMEYRVAHARGLAASLEKYDRLGPNVVLLDEHPLLVEGIALLERFRREHPACPIVLLTRHEGHRLLECVQPDDHLMWDELSRRALARAIAHVIERQQLRRELARARRRLAELGEKSA